MAMSVSLESYARLVDLAAQQHQALLKDDLEAFSALMAQREEIVAALVASDVDGSETVRQQLAAYLEQVRILDERMVQLLTDKAQETSAELGTVQRGKAVSSRYLVRQYLEPTVSRDA